MEIWLKIEIFFCMKKSCWDLKKKKFWRTLTRISTWRQQKFVFLSFIVFRLVGLKCLPIVLFCFMCGDHNFTNHNIVLFLLSFLLHPDWKQVPPFGFSRFLRNEIKRKLQGINIIVPRHLVYALCLLQKMPKRLWNRVPASMIQIASFLSMFPPYGLRI